MTDLLLGIDLGTTATKVVVLDPDRGVVGAAEAPVRLRSPDAGHAEADPSEWWANVRRLVPEALERAGARPHRVAALATTGMVPAVLVLDDAGTPRRPAILQNDVRAAAELAELADRLAEADLVSRTGSPLSQQSVAPTLVWLARHEPEILRGSVTLAGSYEWLLRRLGADPHVEVNWALESGLYELDGRPAEDVRAAAAVRPGWLPAVRSPGDRVGALAVEAADALGLRPGVPLVVGGADHVSAAYAAGLAEPGDTLVKLGGAGDILTVTDHPVVDARLYLDRHPAPGRWLPNGCMATSGSLLRWFQEAMAGDADLARLDAEAAASGPGAGGLVCLPYLLGEKSPLHDPLARGAFVGLHLGHRRGDLFRACLEAVGYGFRHHLDVFAEAGLGVGQVRVTNGGSRSTLWKQVLADACDLTLHPVVGHGGAALGAAVTAGVGIGLLPGWEAVGRFVSLDGPVVPDPAARAVCDERYAAYRALEPALRPIVHRLAAPSPLARRA